MNPLEEYPNLFCNGEFKIKFHDLDDQWKMDEVEDFTPALLQIIQDSKDEFLSIDQCKLIARPIDSLTDEEIFGLFPHIEGVYTADDYRKILSHKARSGGLLLKDAIKLANKGVYFGSQSHFGDTVIDTRTLTNA